ncbi:hypothetical protein [Stieleria varia]|uniref:Transmembrane protein n=1 Tax=Stieleria varia TaxID=2528005 RepID=A0A5C5ZG97_9BACT|nr:hypothetical protein [Stieleria varia]TWT86449.1 hypothetical protein Pla52n_70820 [Stieleria varia]
MNIPPFVLLLALLPLVGYLLVLGLIRISGLVLVTTGARDIVALGFAIAGLIAVGPGELFFPNAAAGFFGVWVWGALLSFYTLLVLLFAITARPRLVVYGRTAPECFGSLVDAAQKLDSTTTVDEQALQVHLPKLGVRLRVAGHRSLDHATIEAFEPVVSVEFWHQLMGLFRQAIQKTPGTRFRNGGVMLLIALTLLAMVLWQGLSRSDQVVQGFRQWLWR